MKPTTHQAASILQKHHPDRGIPSIRSVEEYTNEGYSFNPKVLSYRIALDDASATTHLLHVARPSTEPPGPLSDYVANDLKQIRHLLGLLHSNSSVPFPRVFEDESLDVFPHHYLLFDMPLDASKGISLSEARTSGVLDERGISRIELELGMYLGQLHNIQNDWFGLPSVSEPVDPSYSWKESFTLFFETLVHEIESSHSASTLDLPLHEIKKYMSRAIGFFLFDDAEVPSLIGFTVSDDDVWILPPENESSLPAICAILPNLSWALWGDPLLEAMFMPPGPSAAVLEGYLGAGGSNPIVFARQKTKRLWYSLFMSLLILARDGDNAESLAGGKRRSWAVKTAQDCAKALKDAPYY
ncbi:hypothetical protein ONZ45_g18321 [Pleurotus djamor]|nr:hypothetical protein ONZ45_g18321 [Pleurotus djamor]